MADTDAGLDREEPQTRSGKTLRAHADALGQDFGDVADALHGIAEMVRLIGQENAGVPGVFATCRGLADTIDGAVKKTRQKAEEVVDALQKPPRESMLNDQITSSVDGALAERAALAAKRTD